MNRLHLFPLKVAKLSDPLSFLSRVIEFIFTVLRPSLLFYAKLEEKKKHVQMREVITLCGMHRHQCLCATTSITHAQAYAEIVTGALSIKAEHYIKLYFYDLSPWSKGHLGMPESTFAILRRGKMVGVSSA